MKLYSSILLALLALLGSVVFFGYSGLASSPMTDLPSIVTTIGVGAGDANNGPEGVAVDLATNRVFVANNKDNAIYVVNGNDNTLVMTITASFPASPISAPNGVAANNTSRKIYVANSGRRSVLVINADSMAVVKEISGLGPGPTGIAVDEGSNLVYVTNFADTEIGQSVSIINGASDTLSTTIGLDQQYPYGIALDLAQHRAYVTHRWGDSPHYVSVIDTLGLGTIKYTDYPMSEIAGIAVRPANSSVFVAQRENSQGNPSLAIFDYTGGVFHKLLPWSTGLPLYWNGQYYGKPIGVAYNPATDRVFVNSYNQSSVVVVDAASLQVLTALSVGSNPDMGVAVNPNTSMVYVANRASGTLTVIRDGSPAPTATPTNTATPTVTPTPTPMPCSPDRYEPDNNWSQASVIIPSEGYPQHHTFCSASAPWYVDEDWSGFFASGSIGSPLVLTMTTSNLTGGADTFLSLYGPNEVTGTTLLAKDDDSGGGLASRIVYSITAPGMYYIHVNNLSPVETAAKASRLGLAPDSTGTVERSYDLAVVGGPPLSNRVYLPLLMR